MTEGPGGLAMTDWREDPVRAWVENWVRVGPQLEALRRRELDAMTDEERWAMIDGLLDLAFRFARPRTTSGLVEQQRWFQQARPVPAQDGGEP